MSIGLEAALRFFRLSITFLLMVFRAASVALIVFALSLPADAQFWGDSWGGRRSNANSRTIPSAALGVIAHEASGAIGNGKPPAIRDSENG
jgi:hypothetical protein